MMKRIIFLLILPFLFLCLSIKVFSQGPLSQKYDDIKKIVVGSRASSSGLIISSINLPATLEVKKGKVEDGTRNILPIDVTISKNDQSSTYSIYIDNGETFEVQYEYLLPKTNQQNEKQRPIFEGFNTKDIKKVKKIQNCLSEKISNNEKEFPNENILLKPAVIGNIIQNCIILNKLITPRKTSMVQEPAFIELCSCTGSDDCICGINSLCMNGLCSFDSDCICTDLQCDCLQDSVCLRGGCLRCPNDNPHRCPSGVCVSDISMCRTLDPEQCPNGLEPCVPPFNESCVAEDCHCDVNNSWGIVTIDCLDGTCLGMSNGQCPRGPDFGCTRRRPFSCHYDDMQVFSGSFYSPPLIVCATDSSSCPVCPSEDYINCPNHTCIPIGADCTCPFLSPFRCPNGGPGACSDSLTNCLQPELNP